MDCNCVNSELSKSHFGTLDEFNSITFENIKEFVRHSPRLTYLHCNYGGKFSYNPDMASFLVTHSKALSVVSCQHYQSAIDLTGMFTDIV